MFFTPVIRRTAYAPSLRALDRSLERFLNDTLPSTGAGRHVRFEQGEQAFTLSLDLPGLGKEHLNIGIEANVVRIETLADAPRTFKAAYELPQDVDASASEARLEHGVLTLKLARKQPVSQVVPLTVQ